MKENYLPKILFFNIIISIIPLLFINNKGISYNTLNAIIYLIQMGLNVTFVIINKNILKNISKNSILIYTFFLILQIIAFIVNIFKYENVNYYDIINSGIVSINILFYIIIFSKFKLNKEDIKIFYFYLVILGLVGCIYNIFFNFHDMIRLSSFSSSYSTQFSSFFPNRNQFGLFLFVCIISLMLSKINFRNKVIINIIFLINLIFTMSRTSILAVSIFYMYIFFFKKKNKIKKIIVMVSTIILLIIVLSNNSVYKYIDKFFIRTSTIETGAGRVNIWKSSLNAIVKENVILGIGRFRTIELMNQNLTKKFTQFHNVYIEMLAFLGLIGLVLFLGLIIYLINKILKLKINYDEKNILLASFISYLIMINLESFGRFSMGYSDTLTIIFFILLPLLYINNANDFKLDYENIKNVEN